MVVVAAVVALLVIAATVTAVRRTQTRASVTGELDRFATASALTARWARDPGAARQPVGDVAAREGGTQQVDAGD